MLHAILLALLMLVTTPTHATVVEQTYEGYSQYNDYYIVEVKDALPAQADIDRVITRHGVWLRPFSRYIYTMPPLVSDTATVARIAEAIRELASCPAGPAPEGDFHE